MLRQDACTHAQTQELLGLYGEIEHSKKMGVVYGGNTVTKTVAGTSAERHGVQSGWRIAVVPLHVCMLHVSCLLCMCYTTLMAHPSCRL